MKFGQQFLSEFNQEWGLDAYVDYRHLKGLLHEVKAGTLTVDQFFDALARSLNTVDVFLKQLETSFTDQLQTLVGTPRPQLMKEDIFSCYNLGKCILNYQNLNHEAFQKIIKKLHKQLGLRKQKGKPVTAEGANVTPESSTLELNSRQKTELRIRAEEFLETVEEAYFLNPDKLDLGKTIQILQILYGETFANGDEILAQNVLEKVWSMDPRSQPRIVDYVDAHFYKQKLTKRESHYAIRLVTGNCNRNLAHNISRCLGVPLTQANVSSYKNGEVKLQILDNIRGDDVFVFQSCTSSSEQSLAHTQMEMLFMIHTARLASASRITAVLPYMAYQNHKQQMRAFAQMVQKMGVDRVLTVDMIQGQIQGYFENTPLDNVKVNLEFVKYFKEKIDCMDWASGVCVVSPRSNAVERAKVLADELGAGLATVIRRRREEEQQAKEEGELDGEMWGFKEVSEIVGDVAGKVCIITSCIVDEGENMRQVADFIRAAGATRIFAAAVHGVFAGDAIKRLMEGPFEEIVVTDTICHDQLIQKCPRLRVLPVAPLLAECIDRIHNEASIGAVFKPAPVAMVQDTPSRRKSNHVNPHGGHSPSFEIMEHIAGLDMASLRKGSSVDPSPVMSPKQQSPKSPLSGLMKQGPTYMS